MAWKTGYYYGSGFGGAGVPYSQYTHVLYESISPNGGGGIDTSPANLSELDGFVSAAHAAGAKALVCIGVANGGAWQGSTSSGNVDSFVSAVHSFVSAHNLDGVDLDWESSIIDSQYASFIQKLRSSFGSGLTITMAAYGGGTGNPKHSAVLAGPSNLDQINMMTYDMDIYEPQTWFETAVLKGPDSRQSIQTAFEEFVGSGIPASKLGIGIPFYGSRYNSASGINQSRSYGGFIAYSNINISGAVVDGTYQGTGVGSNPWITFAGATEIADIVAYGSSVGAGGYMTFPINWEDNSNTLSGALNTAVGGGSSPTLPTIFSFTSDTTTVASGGPVTFTWTVGNATSLSINGTTVTGTSHTFNPTTATDYVLTATNADGSTDSATVHVAIGSGPPSISSFTATPSNFVIGQPVTLAWTQSLGTSVTIDPGAIDVTGLSSKVVNPGATTAFTLTVSNSSATVSSQATATLGGAPPVINSLTASDSSIAPGDPVTISFNVSGAGPGAGSITLNGVPVTGDSVLVAPISSTKFILVVTNNDGTTSQSITIDVIGPSPNNLRIWQVRQGDQHGTDDYFQISDGTGTVEHLAKYNWNGSVTDSTIRAGDVLTSPGGGTGLTAAGQNSWYGQIPVGPINGSNTRFLLDYTLANPWPALYLRGVFQWPFQDGDGSQGRPTAIPDYDYIISGAALTTRYAPQPGDRFYIEYFRNAPAPPPATAVSAVVHVLYSYIYGTPTLSNHGIVQLSDAVYFAQIFDGTPQTLLDKTVLFATLPAGFGTGGFPQNLTLFGSIFDDLTTVDELRVYDYYAVVTYSDGSTSRIYPAVEGVPGTGGGGFSFDATHATGDGSVVTYSVGFPNNNPPSDLAVGMLLRTIDFPTSGFNVTNAVITSTSLSVTSPAPSFGSGYYVTGTITIDNPTVGNEDWPATERNASASNPGYYGTFANINAAVDGDPTTYATIQSQHYFPTRSGSSINFTF